MRDSDPAPGRAGRIRLLGTLALWLVVAAGVAGFALLWARAPRGQESIRAQGEFWEAVDPAGAVALAPRALGGLALQPGETLRLRDPSAGSGWTALTFEAQKLAAPALLQVDLGGLVLAFIAEEPLGVLLAEPRAGAAPAVVQRAQLPDLLKNPFTPFRVRLTRSDATLEVQVNGVRALTATDARLAEGVPSFAARDGAFGLRSAGLAVPAGSATPGTGSASRQRVLLDEFAALQQDSPWRRQASGLLIALACLAGAGLYLHALCLGRPALRDVAFATAAWAATSAALGVALLFLGQPGLWMSGVVACLPGLLVAIGVLRRHLRAPPDGASRRTLASLSVTGVLLALGLGVARSSMSATPAVPGADAPPSKAAAADYSLPGSTPLDAGNALVVPGARHDVELTARAVLAPDAVLELRLRADAPPHARGLALWVTSDARQRCTFVHETAEEFQPCGSSAAAVAGGREVELRIRAQGERVQADVDGAHIEAEDAGLPQDGLVLLAARGAATLLDLHVRALPAAGSPPPAKLAGGPGPGAAVVPLGGWLAFAVVLCWLSSLPLPRALELTAFALLPLAIGGASLAGGDHVEIAAAMEAAWVTALLLMLPALVHARSMSVPRLLAIVVLACVLAPAAVAGLATAGRGAAALLPPASNYVAWSGDRLDDDLLSLRHPLARLLDDYLGGHAFRGRQFALAKPAGTRRVLALGGSSTWGFGLPETERLEYPALLEPLLSRASDGASDGASGGAPRVEVINAAWQGATGVRLFHALRDGLLGFAPDVVTLCLTYNDAFALTRVDEEAEFAAIGAPGFERSWLGDWATAWRVHRGDEALGRLLVAMRRWTGTTADLWASLGHGPDEDPPQRFETLLRRYAELARERGFRLVLIKEPWGGERRLIWREEFAAAIDRVGAEYGLRVVDPAPALEAAGGRGVFQDDIHPRAAGHAVIARVLAPVVRSELER